MDESEEDTLVTQQAPNRPRLKTQDEEESDSQSMLTQHQLTSPVTSSADNQEPTNNEQNSLKGDMKAPLADRFMVWYADRLLHPTVKIIVVVAFSIFFAACA